jgi:D-alanyl-D-alanine carboxypeptidase
MDRSLKVERLTMRSHGSSLAWMLPAIVFLPASARALPLPDSSAAMAAQIDAEMSAVYRQDRPGAAVIVVKDGQVLFRKGYGLANLELGVPVKPETVFRLGSVTKQFTATAIMILVDQGKLRLDDNVSRLLPGFPTHGKTITVEQLLRHTSGLPDYLDKLWPARMRQFLTPAQLIDVFKNDSLRFEPGTKVEYSNANYVLLGAILERVSGTTYRDFVENRIFAPLGMKQSFYERSQTLLMKRASGYVTSPEGTYLNAAYLDMSQLFAAGGLCSSVDDLALWDAAIASGKLLAPETWARVFAPYELPSGEKSPYALGWAIGELQGRVAQSHAGGIPGFRAYVLRIPDDHVFVALLSNDETAETQPEVVARKAAAIAIGKPLSEQSTVTLSASALDRLVGEYALGEEKLTVRRDGNKLMGQAPGDPEFELFPVGNDAFIVKAFDGRITFLRAADGTVTGLIERGGGSELTLRRVK